MSFLCTRNFICQEERVCKRERGRQTDRDIEIGIEVETGHRTLVAMCHTRMAIILFLREKQQQMLIIPFFPR